MSVDPQLLTAIESIYAAATDESLWQRAMQQLLDVTDSQGATFCVIDASDKPKLPILEVLNFHPQLIAEYLDYMAPHDPTVQYIVAHPEEKLIHDSRFISEREKDKHFYYDWHHRFSDTRHRLAGMVSPTAKVQSGITLHRTKQRGDYQPADIERFEFLYGHLERAVHIAFRLGTLGTMQRASFELLDGNPLAIILLDEQGAVLFANRAAEDLAAAGDGVSISPSGIVLRGRVDDQRLRELIGAALALDSREAVAAPSPNSNPCGVMHAFRPSGRRPYSILVSPIARVSFSITAAKPAVCVVIADPERRPLLPGEWLRVLYGLTPSEARLASQLAAGEELRAAADVLGIGYATARTQLAAIFRKTATRRQGELIKLLLSSVPSPLR
jgi:DNA-binding CsgD family transcriptional regulator/PAS domain-containing protein